MLLTLLSKNSNWGQTDGQLEGWYADTPGQFDTSGVENAGFVNRQALITAAGRDEAATTVTVSFKPFIGIMKSKRLLLSDMNLRLSLTRSKPEFYTLDLQSLDAKTCGHYALYFCKNGPLKNWEDFDTNTKNK